MTTNNENTIGNFETALQLANQSLRNAIASIDDLNGRLEELEHYGEHRSKLSDEARDTLQDAYEFYIKLPVWDTIETLSARLTDVRLEVKEIKRREAMK